ncbi:MAG: hypothetical protein R6W83_12635 [Cryobacterium sp.]
MTHTLPTRWRRDAAPAPDASPRPAAGFGAFHRPAPAGSELPQLPELPDHFAAFEPLPGVHLVVGRAGVFTVTVYQHPGAWAWADKRSLVVSARRTSYLLDAEANAAHVTDRLRARFVLRTPVRPVVALAGGRVIMRRTRVSPVTVLSTADLTAWLTALPTVLRPSERMHLAAHIDNPATWGVRPRPGQAAPH